MDRRSYNGTGIIGAINVKVYGNYGPDTIAIMERFGCDEATAEQALQYAFDSDAEMFWHEHAPELAREHFGEDARIYSAGRSGGWLYVDGLGDPETWDEETAEAFEQFEKAIDELLKGTCDYHDGIMDTIDANRWAEPDAERFNFIDGDDGSAVCVADVKREQQRVANRMLGRESRDEVLNRVAAAAVDAHRAGWSEAEIVSAADLTDDSRYSI